MSLPSPVTPAPEFEVLWSVIVSDAVLVVDCLVLFELAAEHLFHYRTMLWLFVTALRSIVQNDIAVPVEAPSAGFRLSLCVL
jgi:hypothetical protein